jgi:hypothetical protein
MKDCTSCGAKLRDKFQSNGFTKTFGELSILPAIDRVYPFVQDYCRNRKMNKDGLISLPTQNGSVDALTNAAYSFLSSGVVISYILIFFSVFSNVLFSSLFALLCAQLLFLSVLFPLFSVAL